MRVLVVEPKRHPKVIEMDSSLSAMQSVVGGYIQAIYPFEEAVALICHEEGKLLGMPLNRALYHTETGALYDIIAGTFFLCAAPADSKQFESLSEDQTVRYMHRFHYPEVFLRLNGRLLCVRMEEQSDD